MVVILVLVELVGVGSEECEISPGCETFCRLDWGSVAEVGDAGGGVMGECLGFSILGH